MQIRPIGYGLLVFIASGLVWVMSSFGAAVEMLTGELGSIQYIVIISGLLFYFSLPAAIVAEIVRWRSTKKKWLEKREKNA